MKEKYIKVIVSGLPKTGKTTLAELIGDLLSDRGFDVTLETDGEGPNVSSNAVDAVIKSGIKILVQEKDAFIKQTPDFRKPRQHVSVRQVPPAQIVFSGQDETLSCIECKTEFVFTVGEQEFYKAHNLDKAPRRCKACLAVKKSRQANVAAL